VGATTGFLAVTIRDFAVVFPDQFDLIPPQVSEVIDTWEYYFTNWDSDVSDVPSSGK